MSKPESGDDATKTEMDLDADGSDERARPFLFLVLEAEPPLAGGARIKDLAPERNRRLASVDSRAAR